MSFKRITEKYNLINTILSKQIRESLDSEEDIEKIDNKLDVIMDALGLKFEETTKEEKDVVEKEITVDDNEDEKENNSNEDISIEDKIDNIEEDITEEVKESLDINNDNLDFNFKVELSNSAMGRYWYPDIMDMFIVDGKNQIFSYKELKTFLETIGMFNELKDDIDNLISDENNDFLSYYYFDIYKI